MTTTRIPEEKRMDAEIRIYRLSPGDAFYAMGHRWVVVWPMWNTSGYASVAGRRFVSLEEAVGCQRHTHDQWAAFSDAEISDMDNDAAAFWSTWKAPLLAMCDTHRAEHFKALEGKQ